MHPLYQSLLSAIRALNFQRVKGWASALGRVGTLQMVIQGLNVVCGILIVRLLPTDNFAMYTLTMSVGSATALATDSGIVNGFVALGGTLHNDPDRFAALFASLSKVRGRVEFFALLVAIPFLAWRLAEAKATWSLIAFVTAFGALYVHSRIHIDVCEQVLRLKLRSEAALRIEARAGFVRLILLASLLAALPSLPVVCVAWAISLYLQLRIVRLRVSEDLRMGATAVRSFEKNLWSAYASQAVTTFYVIFNAQAMVLLMSFFAGNVALADIGALARFAALFTLISALLANFAYPRIARASLGHELRQKVTLLIIAVSMLAVAITAVVWIAPWLVLWVLGPRYQHLSEEVRLYFAMSSCSLVVAAVWGVSAARGWFKGNWVVVPASIAAQILALAFVDVSTVRGAIFVGWAPLLPQGLVNLGLMIRGFKGKGVLEVAELSAESDRTSEQVS
jgi:hypothetical protein